MDSSATGKEIRNLASYYSRPGVEADDLEQEAHLAFLRASARYDPGRGASLRTYARYRVIGSMRSLIRSEGQRQQHELKLSEQPPASTCCPRSDEQDSFGEASICLGIFRRELLLILERVISELPPKQRLVVGMRYRQGKGFNEIGKTLGVGESTAWGYHEQALGTLKTRLHSYGVSAAT